MLKKSLSVLLAVLMALSCMAVCVSAVDGEAEEPQKTDSGYYVGQILKPGDKITSVHETCEMLTVAYGVSTTDAENVTSALQKQFASEEFVGVVSFRDSIASFTSGEAAGSYTVKAAGAEMDEMEVENGKYKSALEIYNGLTKDEQKELDKQLKKKKQSELVLTMDYEYAKTTYYQYTTITGWEITYVNESETAITVRLQAVYETREPTGSENFVEKIYVKWLAFLDVLGNLLLKTTPKMLAFWAKLLGNK